MPPYDLMHQKDFFFMCAVGLGLAILVILARGSRYFTFSFSKKEVPADDADAHEFGGGVSETDRPVPILIWVVFIGYFIWAAVYIVAFGAWGA